MEFREPTMVCERKDGGPCAERDPCAVIFEAPTLGELGGAIARWIAANPRYTPTLFSHAAETRMEPMSGLAPNREVTVYTGVLLVHRTDNAA